MKTVLACVLACALAFCPQEPLRAPDPAVAFRAQRYAEAFALYELKLTRAGTPSGTLLYNLGTCAYRLERYADAMWFYRRAELRLPRDEQLRFNLRMVRRQLGTPTRTSDAFGADLLRFLGSYRASELLGLVGGLQLLGLIGFITLRSNRLARRTSLVLMITALVGGARLVQMHWFPGPIAGVVLQDGATLHTEPHGDLGTRGRLQPGAEVEIIEMSDRWARVQGLGGKGWVQRSDLGVVD